MMIRISVVLFLLALVPSQAETFKWQPITNVEGLFFRSEISTKNNCVIRLREDEKLRRTKSNLTINFSFETVRYSKQYSAYFEARDTETVYLNDCDQVLNVVATCVRRF